MRFEEQDIVTDAGIVIERGGFADFTDDQIAFLLSIGDLIQELVNNAPVNPYVTFPEAMV